MNRYIYIIILIIILFVLAWEIELFDYEDYNIIRNDKCYLYIDINCKLHFGDNIFNIYYLNFLKNYLENNNIKINYYLPEQYINEISKFKNSNNVNLLPYEKKGLYLGLTNMTFNNNSIITFYNNNILNNKKIVYDKLYLDFFNEASEKLGINIKMNNFLNTDESIISEYEMLDDKYKNLDILIINSEAKSFQYINLYQDNWDEFIINLNKNFKIATTLKVNNTNINCTMDDNLSLKNISSISTHSKYIIGINTGPMATIFNIYTMNYVKCIYIFDNRVTFSYPKIIECDKLSDIDVNELKNNL